MVVVVVPLPLDVALFHLLCVLSRLSLFLSAGEVWNFEQVQVFFVPTYLPDT